MYNDGNMINKLLIATNNKNKLKELNSLFEKTGIEITSLKEEGIDLEVEETGKTFKENAKLKAKAYMEASGLPTLADDSGLVVQALGGKPGVYSARYAGESATDEENIKKLLKEMKGIPTENRTAQYKVVFAIAVPGQEIKTCEGSMKGIIAEKPIGNNGFGYDPVFYIPRFKATAAEITQEQKNSISHRRIALGRALYIINMEL